MRQRSGDYRTGARSRNTVTRIVNVVILLTPSLLAGLASALIGHSKDWVYAGMSVCFAVPIVGWWSCSG